MIFMLAPGRSRARQGWPREGGAFTFQRGPRALMVPASPTSTVPHQRFAAVMSLILEGSLHRMCGGRYTLHTETVSMRISGMAADVEREFYRCDKCGNEQRTIDQREAAEKRAIERIRAAHDLLTPKAIKYLRESLGLTVAQLAELCYGTPKGIVEGWEKGKYLQNQEADALLRSLEFPETLERRAAKAGVVLPPKPGEEPHPAPTVPE